MKLREYFDIGLTVDAYTQLLNEDQMDLHKLYERRAEIDEALDEDGRAGQALRLLQEHGLQRRAERTEVG